MRNKTISLLICFIFSGCTTIAPLSNTPTARTSGKGHIQLSGGYVASLEESTHARIGYGLQRDLDIYFLVESGLINENVGIGIKYAVINPEENGLALSIDGSLGSTRDDMYYFFGPTISYKTKYFEPFSVLRFNYAHNSQVLTPEIFPFASVAKSSNLKYGQATLGSTIWISNYFGFYAHIDKLFGDYDSTLFGGGVILKTNRL